MMIAEWPTLTAEVRLIEFPYFLTETWRKIGQKGNALGEVFGMAAAVVRQTLQRPGIGLPLERGRKRKKERWKGRERERKEDEPHSRLAGPGRDAKTTRRQPRGHWLAWPVPLYVLSSHAVS
jgi:hypothetical protein